MALYEEIVHLLPLRQAAYFAAFFVLRLVIQAYITITYKLVLARQEDAVMTWLSIQAIGSMVDYVLTAKLQSNLLYALFLAHTRRHREIYMRAPRELRAGTGTDRMKYLGGSYDAVSNTVRQCVQIISSTVDAITCTWQIVFLYPGPGIGLIAAMAISIALLIKYKFNKMSAEYKAASKRRANNSAFNTALYTLIGGDNDARIIGMIESNRDESIRLNIKHSAFWAMFGPLSMNLGLIICMAVWIATHDVISVMLIATFGCHIKQMTYAIGQYMHNASDHNNLEEFEAGLNARDADDAKPSLQLPDVLDVANINYTHYVMPSKVVKAKAVPSSLSRIPEPIHLNGSVIIEYGDRILIYGSSGSGKSTLAGLLVGTFGIYELGNHGSLSAPRYTINGETQSVRSYHGIYHVRCESNTFGTEVSLRDLLTNFVDDGFMAMDQVIWGVLEIMGLSEWARRIGGLDKPIGGMSTGERRRLYSCCMLINVYQESINHSERRRMIVFDEIVANMDWERDAVPIIERLFEAFQGNTIIMIEHAQNARDPRLRWWDKRIVVNTGAVCHV